MASFRVHAVTFFRNCFSQLIVETGEGAKLVACFIPTLLAYLGGRVRARGEKTEIEGGNLQLEFSVLSR